MTDETDKIENEVVLLKVEVEVPKEIYEVGLCVSNMLQATGVALKDGWQAGQDIPVILTGALSGLMTAIEGCQKVLTEAKIVPFKFAQGITIPVLDGAEKLMIDLKK